MTRSRPPRSLLLRLDWSIGLLVLCLTLVIGAASAGWSLQQLRVNAERESQQDVQAMAQSVAQTLATQIGRAVRLGIPLADIPGMPDYLERALTQAPGLASIAVQQPDGSTLHATRNKLSRHRLHAEIQAQGHSVGRVVVSTAPTALSQGLVNAYVFAALLVAALSLLSGWAALRGPGKQWQQQRELLQAGLAGAPLPANASLPDANHGSLVRALQALTAGREAQQEQEAAVQAYADELLAVDFDQRLQAPVAAIVAGRSAAALAQEGV